MNCKQGENAFIVRCPPKPGIIGHVVTCLEFLGDGRIEGFPHDAVWHVEYHGKLHDEWGLPFAVPDAWLQPIRGGELAADEVAELYQSEQVTA